MTTKDVTQLVCSLRTFFKIKPATRFVTESPSFSSLVFLLDSVSSVIRAEKYKKNRIKVNSKIYN